MRSSPRLLLAAAAACAAVYGLVMLAAYVLPGGPWVDAVSLGGLASLRGSATINTLARDVANTCDAAPFALASIALLAFALATRGPRRTAAVAALLVGANVSSQLLKPMSTLRDGALAPGLPHILAPS